MLQRILESKRVRASAWGLLIAVLVAAGGGAISEDGADRIGEGLLYTVPTALAALFAGWKGGKKAAELPPAEGGPNHG